MSELSQPAVLTIVASGTPAALALLVDADLTVCGPNMLRSIPALVSVLPTHFPKAFRETGVNGLWVMINNFPEPFLYLLVLCT